MDSVIPVPDQRARPAVPAAPGEAWRGTFTPPAAGSRAPRAPGAFAAGRPRAAAGAVHPAGAARAAVRRAQLAGGPGRVRVRGGDRDARGRAVAELRGHADRRAAAGGRAARRPAVRCGQPGPGQQAGRAAGGATAAVAEGSWGLRLDPAGADGSSRVAGLPVPAAQAAARGAGRDRRLAHPGLRDPVPDVSAVVGGHPPAHRARRGHPGAGLADLVALGPGVGGAVHPDAAARVRPGAGGRGGDPDRAVVDPGADRRGRLDDHPAAGREFAAGAGARAGAVPGPGGGRLGRPAAPDRARPARRRSGPDGRGGHEAGAGQGEAGRHGGPAGAKGARRPRPTWSGPWS